jgi:hypothetical protein
MAFPPWLLRLEAESRPCAPKPRVAGIPVGPPVVLARVVRPTTDTARRPQTIPPRLAIRPSEGLRVPRCHPATCADRRRPATIGGPGYLEGDERRCQRNVAVKEEERLMSCVDAIGLTATPTALRGRARGGLTFD